MSILPFWVSSSIQRQRAQNHKPQNPLIEGPKPQDLYGSQKSATTHPAQRKALLNHFIQKIEHARKPNAAQEREDALEHLRMLLIGCEFEALQTSTLPNSGLTPQFSPKVVNLLAAFGTAHDIKLCNDLGIDLNTHDGDSACAPTPLLQAAFAGNLDTMRALLTFLKQKQLQQKNAFGETALDIALRRKDDSMVKALKSADGPLGVLHRWGENLKKELRPPSRQLSLGDSQDFDDYLDEGPMLWS
jgi:hypothetical protein